MKKIYFIFVFFTIFVPLCFADTIYLKSGKEVKGKIIEESDKYVRVEVNGIILRYYLDEINRIQKEISPEKETFTLKPSPLIVPSETGEKIEPETQTVSETKITDVPRTQPIEVQPGLEATEPEPTLPLLDTDINSEDDLAVERIVKEYLSLVIKPLPEEKEEKKKRLQQLADTLDLNNMPTFKVFKQISAQDVQKKYKASDEAGSTEDKFLESDILGFQKKYLTSTTASVDDFKIVGIYFSKERDQTTAIVNMNDKTITFKLQKHGTDWVINSIY
ncbi:MAG: hypothetical protein AB1629_04305 [Candidatus Omnitrophota bacterium]